MKKRRGNGEGSIFEIKKKGLFAAELTVGYDENGKRRRKTVYGKTKKEVIEKLNRLQMESQTGMLGDSQRKTVAKFLAEWMESAVRPVVRPNTYISYEVIVRRHINPRIGGHQLSKLTPIHVTALLADMEKAGTSPRLRQFTHAVLHRALEQAVQWGLVPRNVTDAVTRPKAPKVTFKVLTPDEARKFLEVAREDRLFALYVLAIATGLRQGELLALKWENVDLKNGFLAVRHTLLDLKGKLELGEPKTAKGRRRIKLPEMARAALRDHKERMFAEGHAGDWVFCDSMGGPLRKSNLVRRSFKPILITAKLPDIRFHDLRHTAATLMLSEDINPKVVQEILGHSQIGVTLDTYSHVLPSMQSKAAERMNSLLDQSGT